MGTRCTAGAPIDSIAQILIIDPDSAGVESLRAGLAGHGLPSLGLTDREAAAAAIRERPPHLVILDFDLPNHGALQLIETVRAAGGARRIGLIIVSARAADYDVVNGLMLGADDYVAKPYSLPELIARVRALLRSHSRGVEGGEVVRGELILNAALNRVTARNRALDLSPAEFRLLEFLMLHPEKAFNRSQLLAQVWGAASGASERTVDVCVQRLRKVLNDPGCDECIQTVRGIGYRFSTVRGASASV